MRYLKLYFKLCAARNLVLPFLLLVPTTFVGDKKFLEIKKNEDERENRIMYMRLFKRVKICYFHYSPQFLSWRVLNLIYYFQTLFFVLED